MIVDILWAVAVFALAVYSLRGKARFILVFAFGTALALAALRVTAAPEPWQLQETRYCGSPARNADGSIKRSTAVLGAFKRIHPCPSTGLTTGACAGWAMNHVIPLACGGCDSVANLDWMPDEIKSCAEPWCRDRYERKIYDAAVDIEGTAACTNQVITWGK